MPAKSEKLRSLVLVRKKANLGVAGGPAILYGPAVLHERRCIAARALQRSRNPNLYPITLSTPRSLNQPCDGEDSPRIYGDRKQSACPSWNCCRGL